MRTAISGYFTLLPDNICYRDITGKLIPWNLASEDPDCINCHPLCADAVELLVQQEPVMPSPLVELWQPVLYLINKLHLTTQLLDCLAAQLSEAGDLRDCLTAGWIARIIAANTSSGRMTDSR